MRTTLSVVALVMLAVSMPHAQLGVDEALTIDNTAGGVALASATTDPAGQRQAVYCRGKLETAQIRYLVNGDAPSTTVGELVNIGDIIEVFRHEHIAAARFIRTGAVSGAVHFTCYSRYPPWVSQ